MLSCGQWAFWGTMLRRLRISFGVAKSLSVWAMAGGIPGGAQRDLLLRVVQNAMNPSYRFLCSNRQLCSGCTTRDFAAEPNITSGAGPVVFCKRVALCSLPKGERPHVCCCAGGLHIGSLDSIALPEPHE
jgi:hypothetical protein